jgi:ABC-type nitrate/sulfonate/bicarbonate transport system ATPase subunit
MCVRVVVLTARPGRIKKIVAIDWPRPRDPFAPKSTAPSPIRRMPQPTRE